MVCALLVTLVVPDLAFAYSDDEKLSDAGFDFTNIGTAISIALAQQFSGFARTVMGFAEEFYNAITNADLFKLGITSTEFADVNKFIGSVCSQLKPVGYTILGVFAGIEGLRISHDSKSLSSQWLGLGVLEEWLFFTIKFCILYSVVTNAKSIMLCIYSMVGWIQTAVTKAMTSSGLSSSQAAFSSMTDTIDNLTVGDATSGFVMLLTIVCLIMLIVCAITAIYIQVLAITRIFEIFVLMAVAPVSLTGFVSKSTTFISQEYLKRFVGAVLQISVLLLIVAIGAPILNSVSGSLSSVFASEDTLINSLLGTITPIASTLALFTMAKQSRPIANSLAGVVAG